MPNTSKKTMPINNETDYYNLLKLLAKHISQSDMSKYPYTAQNINDTSNIHGKLK